MRRAPVVALCAVLLTACGGNGGSGDPTLTVAANGRSVEATAGSYCQGDTCGDAGSPLPTPESLPVRSAQELTLTTNRAAKSVFVHLLHFTKLDPHRQLEVKGRGKRWTVRLPARIGELRRLSVLVKFAGADDAAFEAELQAADA